MLYRFHFLRWCLALALGAGGAAFASAGGEHLGVGATFQVLHVGAATYHHVTVRSLNARTVTIAHDGGLASVHLRDLSPELQAAFGYDPAADAAAEVALKAREAQAAGERAREHAAVTAPVQPVSTGNTGNAGFDRLLQDFAQPLELRPAVDLRPRFFELSLHVKNQGPRPSCAVFAIVSVLEFENAQLTGRAERFSEEYLLWATAKILNRPTHDRSVSSASNPGDAAEPAEPAGVADEGFALSEVVTALRTYGVPLLAAMPYTGARASDINPAPEVIAAARTHRRVSVFALPGRDNAARLAALIHALNAGIPVAVGLKWPPWSTLRTGYLSEQPPLPGVGHAVTIVGYQNKTGALADTVFIFKNSWGPRWGAAGYGYATYAYMTRNLEDTALLDVAPGDSVPSALESGGVR